MEKSYVQEMQQEKQYCFHVIINIDVPAEESLCQ